MRRKIGERVVAIARSDEETVPPGRKVQAIGYVEAEGSIGILFDFHTLEDYNRPFEKTNYRDAFGMPGLRGSESRFYPANRQETVYFDASEEQEHYFIHLHNGE